MAAWGTTPLPTAITAPALAAGSTPVYGAPLTFSTTVTPTQGSPAPTGTVTFTVDGLAGTPQIVVSGAGSITLKLTAGSHTISAHYSGDANNEASTSTELTQLVDKADTLLTMSSNPAQLKQAVGIRAAPTLVTPAAGYLSGTVDFTIYGGSIPGCGSVVVQNGVAICNTSFSLLGTLTVVANYSGDANTKAASATLPLTIGMLSAGTWAAFSPSAPVFGAPVTLNTLLIGATGVPAPTGTVTYSEGSVTLGTAPVDADERATVVVSAASAAPLGAGTHTINVVYSGDANYQGSTAEPLKIVVAKAATALTLGSATAQVGQAVTLKATAKVVSPGAGIPTGKVSFSNGETAIPGCTALTPADGVVSCTTTFTQLGALTLNAAYAGDANTEASTATAPLTVGKVVAGIYSAFTPSAPVFGTPVTVNVLLMGASGVAAPTGTVAFSDGSTSLGSVNVSSEGKASLVLPSGSGAPLAVGTHSIVAVYGGDANYQTATATALSVAVGKAATSIALTSSTARVGQPVTLTAALAVVSPGSATPAGTLDFTAGGKAIGGCTGVALQSGAATCNTSFAQLGDYTIAATYSGDDNTAASTATLQLSIGKAGATVQTVVVPAAPLYGTPLTITAAVAGVTGMAAPTGTVTFTWDGGTGIVVPLGGDGRASLALPLPGAALPGAGAHTVTATYSGDANYGAPSAAPFTVTVGKAATSTALTVSAGAPMAAAVTLLAPASGTPSGAVQFFQNGAPVGTAPLAAVGTSFVATLLAPAQSGNFWAVYQGDANCAGSASQLVTLTNGVQVSLSSDTNPSPAGQPVVFTIKVSGTTGTTVPGGTVQLTADGVSLGSAALTGGLATLVATSLEVGSHTIVASYSGDSVYSGATANLVQVVNKAAPSLTLTADPAASVFGQTVTLTAQLGLASGTVQFLDGTASLGSAQAASGTATLTVSNLAAGTHSLTASWAGDAASSTAVSTAVPLTVNKAQTTTRLEISGSTVRATVTVVAPGVGQPTGTVKFLDGTTNLVLAAAALDAGVAAAAMPSSAGSMVAVYAGDANFLTSNSASVAPLTALNAASYGRSSFAPDEIVTLFGPNLSPSTQSASSGTAKSLGGTTVSLTDFSGTKYDADLLFVSPEQASFLMPAAIAPGPATVMVNNPNRPSVSVTITVTPVAPGLFTLNSTGEGVAAAQALRVRPSGVQDAPQDVAVYDKTQEQWIPMPIDLGDPDDTVYLMLYATGLRHYKQPPVCTIAGQRVTVAYAGEQGSYPGVDQINLVLPRSLRGVGVVDVTFTVDGATSNKVTLAFQ